MKPHLHLCCRVRARGPRGFINNRSQTWHVLLQRLETANNPSHLVRCCSCTDGATKRHTGTMLRFSLQSSSKCSSAQQLYSIKQFCRERSRTFDRLLLKTRKDFQINNNRFNLFNTLTYRFVFSSIYFRCQHIFVFFLSTQRHYSNLQWFLQWFFNETNHYWLKHSFGYCCHRSIIVIQINFLSNIWDKSPVVINLSLSN